MASALKTEPPVQPRRLPGPIPAVPTPLARNHFRPLRIVGEYVSRRFEEGKARPLFIVREARGQGLTTSRQPHVEVVPAP
ncbi:hypothetical protein ACG04R_25140 [Roseateles sp. BYS78W]|uniref:Uncharacterized protein n=1 Tax=Pelomonas candidula TaxID=3299025 RepID=A0ABW7HJA3_9BURK